jgi:uncharacterized membrane protein YqgA involved in biofilm formation
MENSLLIGALIMAVTSFLPLAGVLIRTGGLVRTVMQLEEKIEKLENDLQSRIKNNDNWRETLLMRISAMNENIKIIETKLQLLELLETQRSQHQ